MRMSGDLHLSLALSLYIILFLPLTLYHFGKPIEIKPMPSFEVHLGGLILKVTSMAGSLSPRTLDEEVI